MNKQALYQTKDYECFRHHEYQQPMTDRHVEKLAESMQESGFWHSKPLSVTRNGTGSTFTLIDGHHRLAAAKLAKVPVFYVIEEDSFSSKIGEFNRTVRVWQNKSFAAMYAGDGDVHYKTLLEYTERGIPLRHAASLLRGESSHSGNAGKAVREGKFKVKMTKNIDQVCSFLDEFKATCSAVQSVIFIETLSILLFVAEFDPEILKARLRVNPKQLSKCNNRDQMLQQLDEIYNFRAREKVPLAFLAKQAMTARNLNGLK